MSVSQASAVIATSEPSDRSASPQNPAAKKLPTSTDSNVGPNKGRKPAWNVPSGTVPSVPVDPIIGGTATWPALPATTSSRPSPKSASATPSSSSDSLKSLSDGSAVSVLVVQNSTPSSEETLVVPTPQQPRPNPNLNPTRRGSIGSDNTHNPQPNNRSSRWGSNPNRRSNNNNYQYHNNNGGGYRARGRGGSNWNFWNNSPRSPQFYGGNLAMTAPPTPPAAPYGFSAQAIYPPVYTSIGYEVPYPMVGHVTVAPAPQNVTQMAPPVLHSDVELEQKKSAILRQIEYYFSTDNLCKDIFLRVKMDDQGWVPISVIAAFKRVQELTNSLQLICDSLKGSYVVEVEGDKIRRRDNWGTWILPASAKNLTVSSQMQGLTIAGGSENSSYRS